MTTPQQAGTPAPVPPAVPVPPPPQGAAGSAGQGAFSNVLSSLVAVITYVTGAIAAIPDHAAACADGNASRPDRVRAFTSLAGKLAIIGVLGFAAWREWNQHIIDQPTITNQESIIKQETARNAPVLQTATAEGAAAEAQIKQETARNAPVLQTATAEAAAAEAEIKQATAREALRRQKAEADEAEARAIKARADACISRVESNAKNQRIDTSKFREALTSGNLENFDPMSLITNRSVDEELIRDCDPAYAGMRSTTGNLLDSPCFKELQAILDGLPADPSEVESILDEKIPAWRKRCRLLGDKEATAYRAIVAAWYKKVTGTDPPDAAEVKTSPPTPTRSVTVSSPVTPVTPLSPPLPSQTVEPQATPAPDPDIEAVRRYKLAADRGDADAQLNLGMMYGAGRGGLAPDPREAARLYKLSADQGNAVAQLKLAYMYENGDVLPKDWREAARLYRLAADHGNADGQANLADFYERGDAGLRKNACEAERLRKLAAAQGNTYAQKNLKEMRVARCKP